MPSTPATNRVKPINCSRCVSSARSMVCASPSSTMAWGSQQRIGSAYSPTFSRPASLVTASVCTVARSRPRSSADRCTPRVTVPVAERRSFLNFRACPQRLDVLKSSTAVSNHRILIIDDNVAIHHDFRKVLSADAELTAKQALDSLEADIFGESATVAARPNFEIDSAHQGQEGVAMAHQALVEGHPYAIAFVDMRMPPGWDGLETIEHLWAEDPDVQVVICSAHTDYDWTEVVTRLGHSDKLLVLRKPAEPIEILQCATALSRKWENDRLVRDQMGRLEEVITLRTRGLEAANRQLRHLATHDSPTGLPNRVLLDDRLQQAIAHADRDMRAFAVLVCDLDRFKLINDSLGHRAGDELLQGVARRLSTVVRTADTVARFGGDEFVLIGTSIGDADDAAELAARVMDVLQAPVRIAAIDIHTSPSIGIAMYPDDGASMQVLLAHADAAMYSAKQNGRGNFRRYAPG